MTLTRLRLHASQASFFPPVSLIILDLTRYYLRRRVYEDSIDEADIFVQDTFTDMCTVPTFPFSKGVWGFVTGCLSGVMAMDLTLARQMPAFFASLFEIFSSVWFIEWDPFHYEQLYIIT